MYCFDECCFKTLNASDAFDWTWIVKQALKINFASPVIMIPDPLHWILKAFDPRTNMTHLVYCAVGGFVDGSVLA